ncbi:MAG: hypothetical protein KatS3mg004_1985 [Bryobacteraceae bacterium]|nr:MAG: hypothetical protein KatS3mg004_1985 [Bryobacteraceae bacterium]
MKQPLRITRRALAGALAAAGLRGAPHARREEQAPSRAPIRLRRAMARVRSIPAPRNISPAFRFIP